MVLGGRKSVESHPKSRFENQLWKKTKTIPYLSLPNLRFLIFFQKKFIFGSQSGGEITHFSVYFSSCGALWAPRWVRAAPGYLPGCFFLDFGPDFCPLGCPGSLPAPFFHDFLCPLGCKNTVVFCSQKKNGGSSSLEPCYFEGGSQCNVSHKCVREKAIQYAAGQSGQPQPPPLQPQP